MSVSRARLLAAKNDAIAAAGRGDPVTACPYGPEPAAELERHVWLRWFSHAGLVRRGLPAPDPAERFVVDGSALELDPAPNG